MLRNKRATKPGGVPGFAYANGEGVPENDAEAVKWYRLATDQGHTVAQFNLGVMCAARRGVLKDSILLPPYALA